MPNSARAQLSPPSLRVFTCLSKLTIKETQTIECIATVAGPNRDRARTLLGQAVPSLGYIM